VFFAVAGTYCVDTATNQKEIDTFLIHGNTIPNKFQHLYLNKMELTQSCKKRYSLGIELQNNCPGAAAGTELTYGA